MTEKEKLRDATTEEENEMALAEQQVNATQLQEAYSSMEKTEDEVRTDAQRDVKLLEVDSSNTKRRKVITVKDIEGKDELKVADVPLPKPELFKNDIVKGNLTDIEISADNYLGMCVNLLDGFEETRGIDFTDLKEFFISELYVGLNLTRSRNGFDSRLMKQDTHISEGTVHHIQKAIQAQEEKKKKGMWGFLKGGGG